jgi:hypothetical protein
MSTDHRWTKRKYARHKPLFSLYKSACTILAIDPSMDTNPIEKLVRGDKSGRREERARPYFLYLFI